MIYMTITDTTNGQQIAAFTDQTNLVNTLRDRFSFNLPAFLPQSTEDTSWDLPALLEKLAALHTQLQLQSVTGQKEMGPEIEKREVEITKEEKESKMIYHHTFSRDNEEWIRFRLLKPQIDTELVGLATQARTLIDFFTLLKEPNYVLSGQIFTASLVSLDEPVEIAAPAPVLPEEIPVVPAETLVETPVEESGQEASQAVG